MCKKVQAMLMDDVPEQSAQALTTVLFLCMLEACFITYINADIYIYASQLDHSAVLSYPQQYSMMLGMMEENFSIVWQTGKIRKQTF